MKYYVMKAISAYRIFREDEKEEREMDAWEVIHGPMGIEEAREACIDELEMQKTCADDEIAVAEEYTGKPYPKHNKGVIE